MTKIVSLRGIALPEPGTPVESLVSGIEKLLEQARSGDIHGIAFALSYADGATGSGSYGVVSNTPALIGRLHCLIAGRVEALK